MDRGGSAIPVDDALRLVQPAANRATTRSTATKPAPRPARTAPRLGLAVREVQEKLQGPVVVGGHDAPEARVGDVVVGEGDGDRAAGGHGRAGLFQADSEGD